MRNRRTRGIAAASCLLGSMAVAPSASIGEELAEWTVMVFLNADNDLEEFGLVDFYEMSDVGSTEDVNIVVQLDRSSGYMVWPPGSDWDQTLRFHVQKNMAPLPQYALEDLGEVNMGSGDALADFVRWAQQRYPAKRYLLDIWDHGQGWRFRQTLDVKPNTEGFQQLVAHRVDLLRSEMAEDDVRFLSASNPTRPILPVTSTAAGAVRYISVDEGDNDKLFNREIQDTLESLLGGEKLDVIGFDACLMAMVETGYAMRNVADVMVASEELEPGAGWDYRIWLEELVKQPTMDAETLGQLLVSAYEAAYVADGDTTLSAVRLSEMDRLAQALSALARQIQDNISTEAMVVRDARDACKTYAPGYGMHGIDLGRFLTQLQDRTSNASVRAAVGDALSALSDAVIANYAGYGRNDARGYGSTGLALYFPESEALFQSDPDADGYLESNTEGPVQFVQDHQWDNLLMVFYATGT